jgi:hypothetical protein
MFVTEREIAQGFQTSNVQLVATERGLLDFCAMTRKLSRMGILHFMSDLPEES